MFINCSVLLITSTTILETYHRKIIIFSSCLADDMMMEENNLPPGFRFHPTDEELITCYLTRKVSDSSFTPRAIAVVDLNKCEPWDLPAKASMGEKEWYFFNLRDRKYPTGLRTNRATEAGYWKTTGKDKEITRADSLVIGMKKTLVFYRGRAPKGEKSNWVMHEYRLENKHSFKANKEEWVVCRIFKKSSVVKKPQPTPSSSLPFLESPNDEANTNFANEYGDIELPNLNSFVNTSSGFSNISVQDYKGESNLNLSMNNMNNMNMDMNNWVAARQAAAAGSSTLPSIFPWTSSLLSSNLSMNSLLFKALQMRSYQPSRDAPSSSTDYNSFQPQGITQFGSDFSSNLAASSSSKVNLDPTQQLHPREQPFNDMDSINW